MIPSTAILVTGLVAAATVVNAQAAIVVDNFANSGTNSLGSWHGCDEGEITCTWGTNKLTVVATNVDYSVYTQLGDYGCHNLVSAGLANRYVHIKYTGSTEFTVALQENNPACNWEAAPYPATWDTVYAKDYARSGNIYIPLSHFNIDKTRALGFAFKGFRTTTATSFTLVELVSSVPSSFGAVPAKKATGLLHFACTRPNSIAFGIDDGAPQFAQQMMKIIKDANIKVTFFATGSGLLDAAGNFSNVYREAIANGHQVALHSQTHPQIEGLPTIAQIDSEFTQNIAAASSQLGVTTKYFRAPYGTDGALTRQRLEIAVGGNSQVINWSVDIEDWLWGESSTPEKQVEAVQRDLAKGGNLFVAHYLYASTVEYFPEFIRLAKATGKQIMRVDQCLQDPSAPPL